MNLYWWILRAQLPVPLKLTLFAMALHGRGLDDIWPSLARVGHFRARTKRMIREHVTKLVTMRLLLPEGARVGGHGLPTVYRVGIVALDQCVDRSIDPPDVVVSHRLLKLILFADLKPHRKLLLWAIAMFGDWEFQLQLLARTLSRSTSLSGLHQLRKDIAQLEADGLIARTSQHGAGRGIRCRLKEEALMAIATVPAGKPGYQLPPNVALPFEKNPGTDRTKNPGTDRKKTRVPISSDRTPLRGSVLRSVVRDGDQRPVHAVENSAPPSPSPDRRAARSTGWKRAGSLIYDQLRLTLVHHLKKLAGEGVVVDTTEVRHELTDMAKGWCARQGVDRFSLPGQRPESSVDIVARVVDDALFLFEKLHGQRLDGPKSGCGGGSSER